ncbi:MAG: ion transporter [Flavobacteriales bacterium]|nr:ion transporter [Flavobacteriales bacterium]
MDLDKHYSNWPNWRKRVRKVIFEADTPLGKHFDVALFWLIIISVVVVMLESVSGLQVKYGRLFTVIEWVVTIFFTIEYVARIISVERPRSYILSFFGIVDLLSILPTYLALFLGGAQSLMVIRTLRLLRIFRVLKLVKFLKEASVLARSLKASRHKIFVFLLTVLTLVVIMGTVMYLLEPPDSGFTSIPQSIYWSIVTLTTVGYGDIAPITVLGKIFASVIMILGYSIIAVPTGIVSAEMANETFRSNRNNTKACAGCSLEGHEDDAKFCKFCGHDL